MKLVKIAPMKQVVILRVNVLMKMKIVKVNYILVLVVTKNVVKIIVQHATDTANV